MQLHVFQPECVFNGWISGWNFFAWQPRARSNVNRVDWIIYKLDSWMESVMIRIAFSDIKWNPLKWDTIDASCKRVKLENVVSFKSNFQLSNSFFFSFPLFLSHHRVMYSTRRWHMEMNMIKLLSNVIQLERMWA